jgi:CheY-like chemotaxis protein
VIVADDGPSALSLFADHIGRIDVVLTDLAMPIMNGIGLARTLRRMEPEIRIIISTGREDDFTQAELDDIGVKATLRKPYSQAALLGLLREVLKVGEEAKA